MIPTRVKQLLKLDWQPWLKRPFYAFLVSLFKNRPVKPMFGGLIKPTELIYVFTNGYWFKSDQFFSSFSSRLIKWLKTQSIREINNSLDSFHNENKKLIISLAGKPQEKTIYKLRIIADISREVMTYVWIAHLLEHALLPELREKSAKYVKGDIDKFIGDASFPERRTALEMMEAALRRGTDYPKILKEFSWMRARDGFSRGYNLKEIVDYAQSLKKGTGHKHPNIPKALKPLFKEARELVYLRTRRTDVLFEFLFLARPILKAAAQKYQIPFSQLKYYSIQSLILGRPKRYPKKFFSLGYQDKIFFTTRNLLTLKKVERPEEISGVAASQGIIRGTVKVITKLKELSKMKAGDIMVTYMTSPNFLPAMRLASAFITDEGGLTCHAAIIAREMKKPCVIGTKIASRVLKDGDLVEVDANQGVVRIIKK